MDGIERIYRHLVRTIRASHPQYATQPFEVGELYQTIIPYRLYRRELGFESNEEYELAMLELLSGARGYLVVDDRMRDRLAAEQSSPHPDPGVVRDFASSHVALAPEALQRLETEGRASGSHAAAVASAPQSRHSMGVTTPMGVQPGPGAPTPVAGGAEPVIPPRRSTRPFSVPAAGEACPFCRGDLPAGRQICFCPHCGQDLTVVHCPACGSELERGWKFCVTCGRTADGAER